MSIDQRDTFLTYEAASDSGLLSTDEPVELPSGCGISLPSLNMDLCLSARIYYEDRTSGILIVAPGSAPHSWPESSRATLRTISRKAAALFRNFERREKQAKLIEILEKMSEATSDHALYDLVLREGKALLGCDRVVIRRINLENGHLNYSRSSPKVSEPFAIPPGGGVTSLAFQQRRTYRIGDVTAPDWRNVYRSLWPTLTRSLSELAVPILLPKQPVRVKTRLMFVEKPIGVVNYESQTKDAFSLLDQYCAEAISRRMAEVLERIEIDKKLDRLRQAAQSLATKRDWDSIVRTLVDEIRNALGYEFVSLSIVDPDTRRIRCIRAVGVPDGARAEEFRKKAVHDPESDNIQACVVRTRQVEVPSPDDPRLQDLSREYKLDKLIRVFVPMIASLRNEVIGTISAGYDRTYREHIYERDVQHLKAFIALGANAMELWRRGTIDRVSHEVNAPLTAVRGNLSSLRRRRKQMPEEKIERALEDMETDTEVLYYQVQQLEYVLQGMVKEATEQPLQTEPVLPFRDIIIKTINQLKPLVRDWGLDPKKVYYETSDIHKVGIVNVDKTKISQVIFNLFMNAVKYYESPETFKILIGADDRGDHYIIKFCDWGMGVPRGLEEKIFEDRYRGPVAEDRTVKGSGLGLTISRRIMREHGGDLILKNHYKPTEFHLIIPKHSRETA